MGLIHIKIIEFKSNSTLQKVRIALHLYNLALFLIDVRFPTNILSST